MRDNPAGRHCAPSRIDNFSSYPHMATFGSSVSRVVGSHRRNDWANHLRKF
jgi:hypothetical protein